MTGYQRLCLIASLVVFGLIVLGGVVRATDSGLGCPDWPRCHGSFIPRWETSTLIEFSHRLTASVAGLLVLSLLVWTWRSYRRVPALLYPAAVAFVLLLFQAWLGRLTVVNELPEEIVALHLATALTILTLLLLLTVTAFDIGREHALVQRSRLSLERAETTSPPLSPSPSRERGKGERLASLGLGPLTLLAYGLTFAVMILGSYVAGAGYGLACNGWPLCNGDAVPGMSARSVQLVFLHRLLALALSVVLLTLAAIAFRSRREDPLAFFASGTALLLFVVQSLIGAANVWTRLADEVSAAHLALATLLWATLVLFTIRVHGLHELLPRAAAAESEPMLARAIR